MTPVNPDHPEDATREPEAFALPLRTLAFGDPPRWLAAGWRDFLRCPRIGLFYGACFVAMGWLLVGVFASAPAYTLALSAGFLLVGPFLCMGLYDASARLERGERPSLRASLVAWRACSGTLGVLGLVLLVLEMVWARSALVVFALSFDIAPDLHGSIWRLVTAPENLGFLVAFTAVGGLFASLLYAIGVISIPMILDRRTDAITSSLVSLRLVLTQTGVMLAWAALIVGVVVLAMAPGFVGLLVAGPVLGHASWHAYRGAVGEPTAA